ncbi:MAG: glycosyl transferase family 4 [Candidatus Aenigmarchaeota archaeon]|nr:glycosyl transferase family 4 [Candidatus Aenigmarchaeota archaeon]
MYLLISTIPLLLSFILTFFLTRRWIVVAKRFRLVGRDMNKFKKVLIPEAGGISVSISISICLLFYVFLKTFVFSTESHLVEILSLLITFLLASLLGFIDDILGWKRGLRQWQKPLLTIPISLPLVVINAGHSTVNIPFIGTINLGLFYPLLLVPVGIVGATNGFNMLAGFNGLEAGLALVIFSSYSLISFISNRLWLSYICLIIVASLFSFLIFNWFPAKVFPGNTFTYSIGSLIACIAILGDFEKFGLLLFLPFFIEFILKARGNFRKESFGKPLKNGSITLRYNKIYGLEHFSVWFLRKIKGNAFEREVVIFLIFLELLFASLAFVNYFLQLF